METRGFMSSFVNTITNADPNKIGTKLGLYMIENNMSATEIARRLGVTRATVYYICQSKFYPRPELENKIAELLKD
jgi:transcriptional regulator with XRE-family HTH domain